MSMKAAAFSLSTFSMRCSETFLYEVTMFGSNPPGYGETRVKEDVTEAKYEEFYKSFSKN